MNTQMALDTYGSKSALRWIRILSPVGLVIATYLTITYVQNQAPYCAGSGGCESVQTSEYVTIIGTLKVPMLGAIGYVLLLALTMLRGRLGDRIGFYLPLLTYGAASIGFFYSAYLTYLEAFVIRAWCYWCLASAILMVAIWILSIIDLRRAWFETQ
jgi:uncharacterized membrane protein